jgi:hypothetical protein
VSFRHLLVACIVAGCLVAVVGVVVTAAGHQATGLPTVVLGVAVASWSYLHLWRERRH